MKLGRPCAVPLVVWIATAAVFAQSPQVRDISIRAIRTTTRKPLHDTAKPAIALRVEDLMADRYVWLPHRLAFMGAVAQIRWADGPATVTAGLGPDIRAVGPDYGRAMAQTSTTCPECDRVVARVRKLLPRQPERIVVLDASNQPQTLRRRIEEAEAFVTVGETTVYLKKQGSTFQQALDGEGIADFALAIIIWHEMAHIAGANEAQAQSQEEQLWRQFVLERRVDPPRGLNYLRLLQNRRSPKS